MSAQTALHGIRWTLLTTIIRRVVSFVLFIFLAKWLTQTDFGIYRSFSLILVLLTYFTNLGLDYHYLVSPRREKLNLLALSRLGLVSSLLITLLLALGGRALGSFYHSAELGIIITFCSGLIFVEAFRRIARVQAQKHLLFRELAIAETLNVIIYSALSLGLIFRFRYAWLFVLLFYVGNLSETLYLYLKLPGRNKLSFTRIIAMSKIPASLAVLGRNRRFLTQVTLTNLVQIYSSNAPVLFLGAMVEPALMGIYFFATQLIAIPVGMFTTSLSQVFFPLFAKRDNTTNLQAISRYTSLVLKAGIPALFAYAIALQYLVPVIWQDKWLDALPLILSLVLFYGTSLLHHPISGIPYICRKPLWELGWNILTLMVRIIALAIGIGVSYSFAILLFSAVSAVMHLLFYFMSLIMLQARLKVVILNILSSLPALVIYLGAGLMLLRFPWYYELAIALAYALYMLTAERGTIKDLLSLVKPS